MSIVVASFATDERLEEALACLRTEGVRKIETYTPKALAKDEEGTGSPLPLLIFIAGMAGAAAMFALETYSDVMNWPVNVGGRPPFSWPAFVPIAFEIGVLWAVCAGFFGYLIVCGLPRLWDPVDESAALREASRAGWVVSVTNEEPSELARAQRLLRPFEPESIEVLSPELLQVPA